MATPVPTKCTGWNYDRCGKQGFAFIDPIENFDVAIDRALRRVNGGPITIVLGDKPCVLKTPIVLKERQSIIGSGYATQITVDQSVVVPAISITGNYSAVRNIRLVSSVQHQGTGISVWGSDGTTISGIGHFTLDSVYCMGFAIGIDLQACWVGRILGCVAEGCHMGLRFNGGYVNDVHVLDGAFGGNSTGVSLSPTNCAHCANTIEHVAIEANSACGVWMGSEAFSTKILNCYFENNTAGDVQVSHPAIRGTVIESNFFQQTQPGILVKYGMDAFIRNNTFKTNYPVKVEAGAVRTTIGANCYAASQPVWEVQNLSQSTQFAVYA